MEIFRLSLKKYANLDGKGGLTGSGRWHNEGRRILYTASTRSLSAFERVVHEASQRTPPLVMLTIWLPDDIPMQVYTESELPKEWDRIPDCDVSRTFGDTFLDAADFAIMRVPSAVIANEYNYLINPLHPDAKKLKIQESRNFRYDQRLQKMIR